MRYAKKTRTAGYYPNTTLACAWLALLKTYHVKRYSPRLDHGNEGNRSLMKFAQTFWPVRPADYWSTAGSDVGSAVLMHVG